MSKITPEMDQLRIQQTYFANQMRLKELEIRRIQTQADLLIIDEEIAAKKATIKELKSQI